MTARALTLVVAMVVAASCGGGAPARRTIEVDMRALKFEPSSMSAKSGERVRFVLRNHDKVDHEFVIGDRAFQAQHRAEAKSMAGMHHGRTPGVAEVGKGKTVTMAYVFPKTARTLEIACYVDDHYESGMRGEANVT